MAYDPRRHRRRSIRLVGYDYTRPAVYFVTVCTHRQDPIFGEVVGGRMHLNAWGTVVQDEWQRTEALRHEVALDAFVVMPNHLHGIVIITPPGTDREAARDPRGYRVDVQAHREGGGDRTSSPDGGRGMARHAPTAGGTTGRFGKPQAGALGTIVGAFKSAVTRRLNAARGTPGAPVWQRGYWDRILRDEHAWRLCRRYIDENPGRWTHDRLYRL